MLTWYPRCRVQVELTMFAVANESMCRRQDSRTDGVMGEDTILDRRHLLIAWVPLHSLAYPRLRSVRYGGHQMRRIFRHLLSCPHRGRRQGMDQECKYHGAGLLWSRARGTSLVDLREAGGMMYESSTYSRIRSVRYGGHQMRRIFHHSFSCPHRGRRQGMDQESKYHWAGQMLAQYLRRLDHG
jgi:hypothetical protein